MSVVIKAENLRKSYGSVVALDGADFEVKSGEIMAIIGDNGAGKSSMIKALSGALVVDEGKISIDGKQVSINSPLDSRRYGIETVYQDLAVAPSLDITDNIFLGREITSSGFISGKLLRMRNKKMMMEKAAEYMKDLKIDIKSMTQPVSTLSGGQRQGVAVARAIAFGTKAIIMDEPTAALGVKESGMVLDLIRRIKNKGLPVILISHNMPHVFSLADRIHIQRLGKRLALINRGECKMEEAVAMMTGALKPPKPSKPAKPSKQNS